LYATEDRDRDCPAKAVQPAPRSCIRNQSLKISLKRTNNVLALPSYNRQRLSVIGRGWCPSRSLGSCSFEQRPGSERVIRSDAGEAHRLSLSARVLSAQDSQVKAKTTAAEALPARFEMTRKQLTKHPEIAALTEPVRRLALAHRPHSPASGARLVALGSSRSDLYGERSHAWPQNHRISARLLILPGYYFPVTHTGNLMVRRRFFSAVSNHGLRGHPSRRAHRRRKSAAVHAPQDEDLLRS